MQPIKDLWTRWNEEASFSGVLSVTDDTGTVLEACTGYRNQSERLPNKPDTAFGIASGTKLFTGLSVCKLIEAKKLNLDDRIWDVLPYDLGQINKRVTLGHLLTHTSGIGDYLDEEADDYDEASDALAVQYPLYLWEQLDYYLQMITPLPQKFKPGERFGYSNAGFIMLGLAIESAAKVPYRQFVTSEIIAPLQLRHTGFYRMDQLPANTALGYTDNGAGGLKTNQFTLPIVGGSDGGLYTCTGDMDTLWRALFDGRILTDAMRGSFLSAHVRRDSDRSYGLGVYRMDRNGHTAHYAVGADAGVSFFSIYFPQWKRTATAISNTESDIFTLQRILLEDGLA